MWGTCGLTGTTSYFRMTSTSSSSGGTVINYSDRFTVTGLSGVTPPNVVKAVPGGTSGPAAQNNVNPVAQGAGAVAPVAAAPGDYNVPYNKQTGSMRYAPMQPFPPTKITKKGPPTPQYPTSAFTIATGKMAAPEVISTITESQTFHAMTMENTVCFLRPTNRGKSQDQDADLYHRLRLSRIPRRTTWRSFWPDGRTRRILDQ